MSCGQIESNWVSGVTLTLELHPYLLHTKHHMTYIFKLKYYLNPAINGKPSMHFYKKKKFLCSLIVRPWPLSYRPGSLFQPDTHLCKIISKSMNKRQFMHFFLWRLCVTLTSELLSNRPGFWLRHIVSMWYTFTQSNVKIHL